MTNFVIVCYLPPVAQPQVLHSNGDSALGVLSVPILSCIISACLQNWEETQPCTLGWEKTGLCNTVYKARAATAYRIWETCLPS